MKKGEEEEPAASDKGWAWIALGAAFTNSMLLAGYMQGIGVFFVEWQDDFDASAKDVGWVGVIIGFCVAVGALLGGALASRFTCRKILVFFGLVFAASMVSGSFASAMWQLYITNLITGLSLGLCLQPSWTAIGYHFNRWLGLANGLSSAGVGMGIVALPPLYQFFSDQLGWRGALQVTGAMMVMCCVCGIMIKPTPKEHFLVRVRKTSRAIKKDERRRRSSVTLPTGVVVYQVSSFDRLVKRPLDTLTESLGLRLLVRYPRFLVVCIGNALVGYSYYSGMVFFQSKVVYDNGIHKIHASFLLSAIGVGSIIGRIGSGFLVDFKVLSPRVLYGLSNLSCSIFSFANPFVGSYPLLLAISIWFGLFSGLSYSLVVYCARLCVPAEDVSTSIGLVLLAEGVGVLFGVSLMALVRDLTNDYSLSFIMCGGIFVLSGLVILLENFYFQSKQRRRPDTTLDVESDKVDNKTLSAIPEEDHTTVPDGVVNGEYRIQRSRRCGVAAISTGDIGVMTDHGDLHTISEDDPVVVAMNACDIPDETNDVTSIKSEEDVEENKADIENDIDVVVTDIDGSSSIPTLREGSSREGGALNLGYDDDDSMDKGECAIDVVSTSGAVVPSDTHDHGGAPEEGVGSSADNEGENNQGFSGTEGQHGKSIG